MKKNILKAIAAVTIVISNISLSTITVALHGEPEIPEKLKELL